ncbi:MAG TPA: GNAT family N-acetyltransferase [Micromonosporaceae bacterium]
MTIRPYRPSDHNACHALWGELTEHRSRLHGDANRTVRERSGPRGAAELGGQSAPGPDAGAGFEEYLTQLNLSGMWVAEHAEFGVAAFAGLVLDGRTGEVDPVVVTESLRGRGIGRTLLARVAEEAVRRGLRRLTISPPVRDRAALHSLHASGFDTIATVTLSYDLRAGAGGAPAGVDTLDLFDLRFKV